MPEQTRETFASQDEQAKPLPRRGAVGDVRLNEDDPDPGTPAGQQQQVADTPEVSIVPSEDFAEGRRISGRTV